MSILDGPRLPPAYGGPARYLVVLLHGYGADGYDLIELGRAWAGQLTTTAFVAPNAPERCDLSATGYQWFPLTFRDPSELWRGVNQAAPILDAFIDGELALHGLTDSQLALVGFSQGTMMALHVGPRRRGAPVAIVGYCGLLAGPQHLKADARSRPPVLLVHGTDDGVIPFALMQPAVETLSAAGLSVTSYAATGAGHGITDEGLALGLDFLKQSFSG